MRVEPNTASMTVRVPHATMVNIRISGYPEPPWVPLWRLKQRRFAALSGTDIVVPSTAQTSSSRQRVAPGPCPHLLVAALGEQSGREQQVHHHPRGQIAHPFLHTRRRRERVVDHLERHELGQL